MAITETIPVLWVQLKDNHDYGRCRIWKLIPVKSDLGPRSGGKAIPTPPTGSGSLPPYDGDQHCTCSHRSTEASNDGFETTVVEVTVATTTNTVTTRKQYRIEGDRELSTSRTSVARDHTYRACNRVAAPHANERP